ncbi:hypothetical protein [Yoonia sp. 208BN28-4]|uniref:hypothetical protein n=1 Tax=Yoonia sp. 208BN28-4 TaxID=3126505 RepID=UPI00309BDB87
MISIALALFFALATIALVAAAAWHIASRLVWLVSDTRRRTLNLSDAAVMLSVAFVCLMLARVALAIGGAA